MCIVPVNMKYENNGKQITIYAMLDNCSQGSCVHEAVKQLGVKYIKTTLSLKILHGEILESTNAIAGMQMKFTTKMLQLQRRSFNMEYLNAIAKEIVQSDDVYIGLLIRANFIKSLGANTSNSQ